MKILLKSFCFFFSSIFFTKKAKILFYAPKYFNRSQINENLYFKPFIDICKKNNINFLFFEEPVYNSKIIRNENAIPFDFIYIIILFLRKFNLSDFVIGKILRYTFFINIKFSNFIVLSQSMIEVFRGIDINTKLFDLQHGILYSTKDSYFKNNFVSDRIKNNNVQVIVSGNAYRNILLKKDDSGYYIKNSHVIGGYLSNNDFAHKKPNNSILVTLQFTDDHSSIQNIKLLNELEKFINMYPNYIFYLKNHPRFNNEVDLFTLINKSNTKIAPSSISKCINICSLHLTAYSTSVFECASAGIPTLFLKSLQDDFNMFNTEFSYPLENDFNSIVVNYIENINKLKKWYSNYYSIFDKDKFLSVLK